MSRIKYIVLVSLTTWLQGASGFADAKNNTAQTQKSNVENHSVASKLVKVGSRGFYAIKGPFSQFSIDNPSVQLWSSQKTKNMPLMIYAHGGAGFREEDKKRVALFRNRGFATLSFDAYQMNGFEDWQFIARKVTNSSKQKMIWSVFKGAVEYAKKLQQWDKKNIFLYGGSNGGRVVLYAGSELLDKRIRGIISEAPAATGYKLSDFNIPTIILFGKLDTWAGRSATDFVWSRRYKNSPISIQDWVNERKLSNHPVDLVFYENAGHLMFEGPLKQVHRSRGKDTSFSAYQGANDSAIRQYQIDVFQFVEDHRQ